MSAGRWPPGGVLGRPPRSREGAHGVCPSDVRGASQVLSTDCRSVRKFSPGRHTRPPRTRVSHAGGTESIGCPLILDRGCSSLLGPLCELWRVVAEKGLGEGWGLGYVPHVAVGGRDVRRPGISLPPKPCVDSWLLGLWDGVVRSRSPTTGFGGRRVVEVDLDRSFCSRRRRSRRSGRARFLDPLPLPPHPPLSPLRSRERELHNLLED